MLDMAQEELAYTSSTMSAGSTEGGIVDGEATATATASTASAGQEEGLPEMTWEENENALALENEPTSTSPSQSPSAVTDGDINGFDEGSSNNVTLPSEPAMVTDPTEDEVMDSPLDSFSNETGLDADNQVGIPMPMDPMGPMTNATTVSPSGDGMGMDEEISNPNPEDVPEITNTSVSPTGINASESGIDAVTSSTAPNEVVGSTTATKPIEGAIITDDEYGEGDDAIGEYNDDNKGENEGEGEPWYAEDDEFNDEEWSEDDEEFQEWEEAMGINMNTEPTYPPTPRPTLAYESPSDDILEVETIAEFDDEIKNVGEKVKEYMEGVESFEDMTKDSNVQVMENPDGLCASSQHQGRRSGHTAMRAPFPSDLELS
eukprot:scaffold13383_cov75-Cyclotella_meneghiniana.AAC.6